MGNTDYSSDQSSTKKHCSHPQHNLTLIDLNLPHHRHYPIAPNTTCTGCKRGPSGSIYTCTMCTNTFFLHKKCFEMPNKITHPCHKGCKLTLLTEPAYANGLFKCDACHEKSSGFSYHCKPCGVDLHILCAVMPLSTAHVSHKHDLKLEFACPYQGQEFSCDICKTRGSNHWLYRCGPCGFDAHLQCASSKQAPSKTVNNHMGTHLKSAPSIPQPPFTPHQPQAQPSHQQFYVPPPMINNQFVQPYNTVPNPVINGTIPAMGVPTTAPPQLDAITRQHYQNGQMMVLQALQQKMQNDQAFLQAMMARGFGGGGALGNGGVNNMGAGLQGLMRLMNGLYGNGGGGLSGLMNGGGGGGFDALQSMLGGGGGGGGGGLDFLNGGGLDFLNGGGLDFLSGGGLDVLGGALGGFF